MFSSLLILAVSVILLVYWFRYTCLLIIQTESEAARISSVSEANCLNLPHVQARLQQAGNLDGLDRALEKDYQILSFLLSHAAGLGVSRLEQALLAADFRIMKICYAAARLAWPRMARPALSEMAAVLTRMAGVLGERGSVEA